MASNNFNEYKDTIKKLQDEIISAKDLLTQNEYDEGLKEAEADYLDSTRNAYVDYVKRNNPFGYDREQLSEVGLGASGKERKALGGSFSEYQSYLSRALAERESINKKLVSNLISSQLKNDEEAMKNAINLAKEELENYWNEYRWNYIKQRDELEDARYEKELKG